MKSYLIILSLLIAQITLAQNITSTKSKIWSLQDCISYAVENNITVKDASLNTNITEVDYNTSKSSRLPDLFGNVSQNFSSGNSIDPITRDYVSEQVNRLNKFLVF